MFVMVSLVVINKQHADFAVLASRDKHSKGTSTNSLSFWP